MTSAAHDAPDLYDDAPVRIRKGDLFTVGDGFEAYYLERFGQPSLIHDGEIMAVVKWFTPYGQELSILGDTGFNGNWWGKSGWVPARYTNMLEREADDEH